MLFSKQTPAAGGTAFAQFDAAWCYDGNGYILNDTGTSLDVRIGASGSVQTLAAGGTLPIKLVFSMAELYVRRTDQSATQVTVEAQVGTGSAGGGTTPVQAGAIAALAAAAEVAGHDAAKNAHPKSMALGLRGVLLANYQGTPTPANVLICGDSFGWRPWFPKMDAPQILGLCHALRYAITDNPGYCGAPGLGFGPEETMAGGAAIVANQWTSWQSGSLWSVPAAGTVRLYKSGAIVPCNQLRIYYLIEPGGGAFSVQSSGTSVSAGFTDEAGQTAVSCDGAVALGSIIISKTAGSYALQITGVSGTCKILAAGFTWSGVGAVNFFDVSRGGANLDNTSSAPSAVMQAFITSAAPQVISHICDDSAAVISGGLPTVAGWWDTAAPNATKLLLGAGPKAEVNGGDAAVFAANVTLAAACTGKPKYLFVDGLALLGSYEDMVALGWNGDGLHLGPQAYEVIGMAAADALHLFDLVHGRFARTGSLAPKNILTAMVLARSESPHVLDSLGRAGSLEADTQFGYDVFLRLVRCLEGRTMAGTSANWRMSVSEAGKRSFVPQQTGLGSETAPGLGSGSAAPTSGTYRAGDIVINTAPSSGTPSYWQCTVAGTPGTWVAHNL